MLSSVDLELINTCWDLTYLLFEIIKLDNTFFISTFIWIFLLMLIWYWPILNGFINFLLILLLGKDFFFDIAVYLQTAIMLLCKFVYTFSLFFSFFSWLFCISPQGRFKLHVQGKTVFSTCEWCCMFSVKLSCFMNILIYISSNWQHKPILRLCSHSFYKQN